MMHAFHKGGGELGVGGLLPEISDRCVSPQVTHTAKRESDLFNHEYDYRLNDLSRIPVNKGTNSRVGWTKYSDLYETVHPSLVLISLCLLTGA